MRPDLTPYRTRLWCSTDLSSSVLGRQPVCLKCGEKGHKRSACPETTTTKRTYAKAVTMAAEDRNGDSAQLSADVPCTSSSEGSTGRPDVLLRSEGWTVRPDGLTVCVFNMDHYYDKSVLERT